ncbi:hypothetical protein [Novosphingobium rosa]|uniref:hypothetical protein n=1 Tax=Novosphingobium rosa TaxID=76978 RepID=UPI0012EE1292|nr:hypothetical protein [Novosphingobium rosa]
MQERSIPAPQADPVARTGLVALGHALAAWFAEPGAGWPIILIGAFATCRTLTVSN